ncbi:MAG: hypothetical protein KDK38_01915, partial [Leptospiraceae bacterium]|nr:hypothetical protein [Leptospiraceae bacterium]
MLIIVIILCLALFTVLGMAVFYHTPLEPAQRAEQLLKAGDIPGASRMIDEQLSKDPEHPKGLKIAAKIADLRGDQHSRLLHLEKLKRSGRYHTEIAPEEINSLLAHIYLGFNRDEDAFESWLQVLKYDPDDFDANRNIGLLAAGSGEFKIAKKYIAKAREKLPEDVDLRKAGMVAHFEEKEEEPAFQLIESLIDDDPA